MTLVSPLTAETRGATSRGDPLSRRACTVFERCDTVSPPALPALASAFADYLLAGREISPDQRGARAWDAPPRRLQEHVARLDAILRRAEQGIEPSKPSQASATELAGLEEEAARFLAETRDLLRGLDADRPAAQRLRLALIAAWGQYDDALATMRSRAGQARAGDSTILAGARDALVRQLESARSLRAQSGQVPVDGGRVR